MDNDIFLKNVAILTEFSEQEQLMMPGSDCPLPSVKVLEEVVELVRKLIFPGFFDKRQIDLSVRSYHIGVNLEQLQALLERQIELALLFADKDSHDPQGPAKQFTLRFIDALPELKRLLYTDVDAVYQDDPAATSYGEIIFSYPVIKAMLHYRAAHVLQQMGIPIIPRIITEMAHTVTGIDIHPGARIGEHFSIDHGTGVVIGETCIIGNNVTLYQGVTLGAKNNRLETGNHRRDADGEQLARNNTDAYERHPIIEDNVTVYSNTTLLGRITIGHDSVIGGNIWLTRSVPPYSRIVQGKERIITFTDSPEI